MTATRLASATTYDNAVRQLTTRQSQLSKLQEQLSASKKVLRPSDDPTGAAQAERAITRMARVSADQRALELQRNAVSTAESTLGSATAAMAEFRTLVVNAGNAALSAADRATIAQRLTTLRGQLLGYANAQDSNGQSLFGGLGSTAAPFVDNGGGVRFDGIAGQAGAASDTAIPSMLDGHATWMDVPTGNGVFTVGQAAGTRNVYSDAGKVIDPSALTGHGYRIAFSVANGVTTYDVIDTTTQATLKSGQPYTAGQAIEFAGISLTASGVPADGNALTVAPSGKTSLFGVLDQAIAGVKDGSNSSGQLAQNVAQSLVQIDAASARLSASRGRAGDLLNQVDSISERQSSRSLQLEADRSRAEDLDTIQALSDFKTQQTAYSAALGSYAEIQKLSLFNFIG